MEIQLIFAHQISINIYVANCEESHDFVKREIDTLLTIFAVSSSLGRCFHEGVNSISTSG